MWNNLIITFHYVRDNSKYYCLTTKDMDFLLDWLGKGYEFTTLHEMKKSLADNSNRKKLQCCLTFDDGLQDHYYNVFPVLKRRQIPAHFFISTLPYIENRAVDIHLIHVLQFDLGVEKFGMALQKKYLEKGIQIDIYGKPLGAKYSKWASLPLSNIKNSLKMLENTQRTGLLHEMFEEHFGNPDDFRKGLYLTNEQISEMESGGMFFGNHGHTHSFLKEMSDEEQALDIRTAHTYLQELLTRKPDTISYPFGSYNEKSIEICKALNYKAGLTVLRGDNTAETPALELKRMDVKEVIELAFSGNDGKTVKLRNISYQ